MATAVIQDIRTSPQEISLLLCSDDAFGQHRLCTIVYRKEELADAIRKLDAAPEAPAPTPSWFERLLFRIFYGKSKLDYRKHIKGSGKNSGEIHIYSFRNRKNQERILVASKDPDPSHETGGGSCRLSPEEYQCFLTSYKSALLRFAP